MGKPKFSRKKYDTPNHPWKEERIRSENELIKKYGLKNKREIWKAATALRKYRGQARELLAKIAVDDPQAKKETDQLIIHLTRYNILPLNSALDDVLALDTESILARRLQTIAYLKGFASTPHQARQLICHGHISIDGKRITVPGYRVKKDEESRIEYALDSPMNDTAHPARPSGEFKSKLTVTTIETEQDKVSEKPSAEITKKSATPQKKTDESKEAEPLPPSPSKVDEIKVKPETVTVIKDTEAKEKAPEEKTTTDDKQVDKTAKKEDETSEGGK
jgi:small subunit ribosomal protein S4